MASAVSYELMKKKLDTAQITNNFKGSFATEAAIIAAYPTGAVGDYAFNQATDTYWYYSEALTAWVDQEIEEADYLTLTVNLTDYSDVDIPYLVVPDTP